MDNQQINYVREGYRFYYGTQGYIRDYQKALEYFSKGAEAGDSDAMNWMGVLYLNGHGVPKDPPAAFKWFLKALETNEYNFYACMHMAEFYYNGEYVQRDLSKTLMFYEQVINCSRDHAEPYGDCCYNAGLIYMNELRKYEDAERCFAKARSCKEVVGASTGIAYMCEQNLLQRYKAVGREKRREIAYSLYKEDATKGDPYAMDAVARIYCEIGRFQDAIPWLEKAAAMNYAPAQERLRNVRAHIRFSR